MRTLVVGDMHLGCGAHTNIFSGGRAFEALLDEAAATPTRVVLNGDTFDFLAHGAPRGADAERVMHMFTEDATSGAVLAALGRVHARGGALLFRAGEHDLALADRGVQAVLVRAISGDDAAATRIGFAADGHPTLLESGGVRVVVTHDVLDQDSATNHWLATHILNPIRREYGVGFADLLRPDYADAAVAALAVNPTAAKLALRVADEDMDAVLRLPRVLGRSGLTSRERQVLANALDPVHAVGLGPEDYGALELARLKLLRQVLAVRGDPANGLRRLDGAEWSAARRLAERFRASAVVFGHTRAVGWRCDDALTAVDAGTWTWLLVASPDGLDRQRLAAWQRTSRIGVGPAEMPLRSRWTAVLLEPRASRGRTRLSLVEWRPDGGLVHLRERWLPVTAGERGR